MAPFPAKENQHLAPKLTLLSSPNPYRKKSSTLKTNTCTQSPQHQQSVPEEMPRALTENTNIHFSAVVFVLEPILTQLGTYTCFKQLYKKLAHRKTHKTCRITQQSDSSIAANMEFSAAEWRRCFSALILQQNLCAHTFSFLDFAAINDDYLLIEDLPMSALVSPFYFTLCQETAS